MGVKNRGEKACRIGVRQAFLGECLMGLALLCGQNQACAME